MPAFTGVLPLLFAALLLGTGVLHLLPRLGAAGRAISARLAHAPGLDLVVTWFTAMPLIVGPVLAGWPGLAAAVLAQIAALLAWTLLHELAHPAARRGPRIVAVLNARVGAFRNHAALWVTAVVVPLFWLVRVAQLVLWPFLVVFVRFPRYRQREWVNVSRHKFDGLVGHDLIWCLYCDWMTGVWALGSEMLRNVESFWCPIRFDSAKKCENCRHDFPDVFGAWVPANATMGDVISVLEAHYPPDGGDADGRYSWFGHPARLTVEGRDPDAES